MAPPEPVSRDDNGLGHRFSTRGAAWSDPEAVLITKTNAQLIRQAIEQFPFEYREVLILRELEELSYKEIAQIVEDSSGNRDVATFPGS